MSPVSQNLSKLSGGIRALASNPIVTGALLWALTRAPRSVQEPLLRQLSQLPVQVSVPRLIKVLKWLFAVGVSGRVNGWLNLVATNGWTVKTDVSRWNWPDEVAVVTGGCSGIGELVVKGLAEKGVKVAVLDVQPLPESLKGYNILFQTCDITDPGAVSTAANAIRSSVGHPSILINNAGIGAAHTILETTPAQLNKIFGVNLLSHWYTVGEFVPDMAKKNKGHIVTVASMSSFVSVASMTDYASTKAGALAFHEGLTQELRHRYSAPAVHTTCVHPTWTRTALVTASAPHLEKTHTLLTAQSVADAILAQVFSCRGGQIILPTKLSFVTGIRGWPNWMQERLRDRTGKIGGGPALQAPGK